MVYYCNKIHISLIYIHYATLKKILFSSTTTITTNILHEKIRTKKDCWEEIARSEQCDGVSFDNS